MDKTINEILVKLYLDELGEGCDSGVDQALSAIKSLFKEKLPEEKIYKPTIAELEKVLESSDRGKIEILPNGEIADLQTAFNKGFNSCLSLITKIIEELE